MIKWRASFLFSAVLLSILVASEARAQSEILELVCQQAADDFVDPEMNGIDWPGACRAGQASLANGEPLADVADDLLGALDLSHTRFLSRDHADLAILSSVFADAPHLKAALREEGGPPLLRGAGFTTMQIDGKRFVNGVLDGSAAEEAGLRVGDEILEDGGAEFSAVWRDDRGPRAFTADVLIRRTENGPEMSLPMQVTSQDALERLHAATEASFRVIERGDMRIAYLRGWSMISRGTGGPRSILEDGIAQGRFATVDAFVFDARGLVGGGGPDLLDAFFAPSHVATSFLARGADWEESPGFNSDMPLFILTDGRTRSAAEIMVHIAKSRGLATLVGQTTAGALTAGRLSLLPERNGLYLAVARIRVEGNELEGKGIAPDLPAPGIAPYGDGQDPAIERALDAASH